MNHSNIPNPIDCNYKASLRRLEEGEHILIGDFFQTWMGNLVRITQQVEGVKAGKHRHYYRVTGLIML